MNFLFPFLITLVCSLVLTRLFLFLSKRAPRLIQKPKNDRWHKIPTPSMGGVAIFASYTLAHLIFDPLRNFSQTDLVFLASTPIFFLGLIDDLYELPPYIKLVGQISVACLLIWFGVHVAYNGNPVVYVPLTLLWIIAITNAFNLLDNMDGLSSGVAIIATLSLLAVGGLGQSGVSPITLIIFAASILGFLFFNFHPAKIFMGDCGSQWIGFMLASFTILDTWTSASNLFLMIVTPALILAVPIFDTILVTFNRKLHGRRVSQGGKDHSSHRFVQLGFSERKTVFVLWGLALVFGLLAVFAHMYNVETWAVAVGSGAIFVLILGLFLTDVRVYEKTKKIPLKNVTTLTETGRFAIMHKRRVVEIALDTFLICSAYVLAYLIRFDWNLDPFQSNLLSMSLPLVVGIKLVTLLGSGLYRGIWTYIDFEGFGRMIRSAILASVATIVGILILYRFSGFSRSLFFIDFLILLLLMGGTRALLRGLRESVFAFPDQGIRVLIIGAGDAARNLLAEIRRNRQWNLTPIAILDDDPRKKGGVLYGIKIAGTTQRLERCIDDLKIDRVILAIPSASAKERSEIEERCESKNIPAISMRSIEETIIEKLNVMYRNED